MKLSAFEGLCDACDASTYLYRYARAHVRVKCYQASQASQEMPINAYCA